MKIIFILNNLLNYINVKTKNNIPHYLKSPTNKQISISKTLLKNLMPFNPKNITKTKSFVNINAKVTPCSALAKNLKLKFNNHSIYLILTTNEAVIYT